ncbi:hypothetical protein G9A89_010614 [Geosiphon pyriformis]|nr:hypothetical protein G9A89_010614 [Geosiphon pyriformis]
MNSTQLDINTFLPAFKNTTSVDINTLYCYLFTGDVIAFVVRAKVTILMEAFPPLAMGVVSLFALNLLLFFGKLNRYEIFDFRDFRSRIIMINILAGFAYSTGGILLIISSFQTDYCAIVQNGFWSASLVLTGQSFYLVGLFFMMLYLYVRTQGLIPLGSPIIQKIIRGGLISLICGVTVFTALTMFWKTEVVKFGNNWKTIFNDPKTNERFFQITIALNLMFDVICSIILILRIRQVSKNSNGHISRVIRLLLQTSETRVLLSLAIGIPNIALNMENAVLQDPLIGAITFGLAACQWAVNNADSMILLLAPFQKGVSYSISKS